MANGSERADGRSAGAETTKQQIYASLKADILGGGFDMGERLYESKLALRYGVSKTPVREALALLQQEGWVEVLPRVGYQTSRVTLRDVEEMFDLRLIVESAAAERAAGIASDDVLRSLENLTSQYRHGDRESYRRFLQENLAFHRSIAEASGNMRLAGVVTGVLEHLQRVLILRLDLSEDANEMLEEHRQIIDAIRRRDGAGARETMARSIVNARQAVVTSLVRLMAGSHI